MIITSGFILPVGQFFVPYKKTLLICYYKIQMSYYC
jgi:hypothetical protein